MSANQRTPLYEAHRRLGGRLVEFAGFDMPVQYRSILEEHRAVREHAGLFDVSHMGQIRISGPAALALCDRLLSRPVSDLRRGRVRYALLCNEAGGVVDDVTAYRVEEDAVLLCVNASNIEKDYRWIVRHAPRRGPPCATRAPRRRCWHSRAPRARRSWPGWRPRSSLRSGATPSPALRWRDAWP